LVTGGAGFIGSHLADRLVMENHQVVVVDDLSNGNFNNLASRHRVEFHHVDVSSAEFQRLWFKVDAIYHLACYPRSVSFIDPARDVEVNIGGMVNVLEIARRTNAKVIFSSNSGIYDTSQLPIDESAKDNPKSPYDINKQTSEQYLKLYNQVYGVPFVIFRFATVYGPRQRVSREWHPVVMEFCTKLARGEAPTIYGDGEQTRDFVYVSDIVDALVKALTNKEAIGETMLLGTDTETSINQLYKTVSEQLGIIAMPSHGKEILGDIRRMRYNSAKANRILGWKPQVTLNEGIQKIMGYLKN